MLVKHNTVEAFAFHPLEVGGEELQQASTIDPLLLRDKLLHDFVEHYTEITPKLHAKNATQAAHKIGRGASRRGQFWASGVSRFLRAILA